jgi:hypothetical protein
MARVTKRRLVVDGADLYHAARVVVQFVRDFPEGRVGCRNLASYPALGGHRGWVAYRTPSGAVVIRETEPEPRT